MVSSQASPPYTFKPSPYSSHSLLLAALPPDGAGRRVLDVGCASGYFAEVLARRGYRVVGVDRPGAAGPRFPASVQLIEADLEQGLPALDGTFTYVICADILEHLRDPVRLLRQLWALVPPDGRLVASLPNSGHLYFRLNVLAGRFPQHDRGLFDRTHLHFYTWRGWVDLLRAGGFRVESAAASGVPVGLALPRFDGAGWVRALEFLAWICARAWKKLFAYQFVVVARPEIPS